MEEAVLVIMVLDRGASSEEGALRAAVLPGAPEWLANAAAAFLKGLDLTDEQLLQIAELKGNTFGKMARGKLELMELRKEIFHELLQPQVDKQKVSGVAQKVKEQISGCIDHMVENMIALSQTLNPDQKKRLHLNIIRKLLGLDDITDQDE